MQDEDANPIKQDIKKGKLRFYPYNINWNYGFLPQTWEDPGQKNDDCGGVFGDNDPVDVVEISSQKLDMGSVHPVKCVGVYAMIDDGELDWKVIAIRTDDPVADKINDVEDIERCVSSQSATRSMVNTYCCTEIGSPAGGSASEWACVWCLHCGLGVPQTRYRAAESALSLSASPVHTC